MEHGIIEACMQESAQVASSRWLAEDQAWHDRVRSASGLAADWGLPDGDADRGCNLGSDL